MKHLSIVLGFITAASAIDTHLWFKGSCSRDSGGAVCSNTNPGQCCEYGPYQWSSISFEAMPLDWNLELRADDGGTCSRIRTAIITYGNSYQCLSSGLYTGGKYVFRSKKRETEEDPSQECRKPDVFILGDGQKYDIKDLDETLVAELAGYVFNGTAKADIPEAFGKLEIGTY